MARLRGCGGSQAFLLSVMAGKGRREVKKKPRTVQSLNDYGKALRGSIFFRAAMSGCY